ncbi:MAG: beta-propeller domain-containing protein [Nannocystaceae bacterium]
MAALCTVGACGDKEEPELNPRLLYQFDSCEDLLAYAKEAVAEGAYYDQGWGFGGVDDGPVGQPDGGTGGGEGDSGGFDGGGPDFSETNVQEAGVDEPDLVKTDGNRIFALARGALHAVDPNGGIPVKLGSLGLAASESAQLFLAGDRVLLLDRVSVYGDYYGYDGEGLEPYPTPAPDVDQWFSPEEYWQVARIAEIDVSDPADMKVVKNLYIGADYVSARKIDDSARVVLRSRPHGLLFKSPWDFIYEWMGEGEDGGGGVDDGVAEPVPAPGEPIPDAPADGASFRAGNPWDALWEEAEKAAKEHNDAIIDGSTEANWLPKYVLEDLSSEQPKVTEGLLVTCAEMMHPGSFSGLSVLSVLTLDLSGSLELGAAVGVFSEGETVYASRENLYVATHPWIEPEKLESYIHKFSLADAQKTDYVASGSVPGYLMSQWSMSEHDGDLRVASTDRDAQWNSESMVTVLRQDGDALSEIGQVGGLGAGEQIYAVRFIGERGYVVTFRQIDPLYTLDLSDPSAPAVGGELKIPGYSAYLHPVGDGLLLGVGREGDEQGNVFGTKLSLFDVSDISAPVELHSATVEGEGASEVEWDHKAFLYWEPTALAVIPVSWWSWDELEGESYFSGAIGYTVDPQAGILELGQVSHPQLEQEGYWYGGGLRRSLVVNDTLFTISDAGVKGSGLADLIDVGWAPFE